MSRTLDDLLRGATLAALFATAMLPAQQGAPFPGQTPPPPAAAMQELAAIVAVEEQQGDLARAEALYREALRSGKLSAAARQLAEQRLDWLRQRLGRDTRQAPPNGETAISEAIVLQRTGAEQDPARLAELRQKARELLDLRTNTRLADLEYRGLVWLGEPVVPEILAKLPSSKGEFATQLVGLLWRIGGPQAAEYLGKAAIDPATPHWVVAMAYELRRPEMLAVAEAFLNHPDFDLVQAMLHHADGTQAPLRNRIGADAMVTMAERGDAERRRYVLAWAANRTFDSPESARLAVIVRAALASSNPTLGAQAQQSLAASFLHDSVAGIELVAVQGALDTSPMVRRASWPSDAYVSPDQLRPEVAARLWPAMLDCARRHAPASRGAAWACDWLRLLASEADVGTVAEVLPLIRSGHSLWGVVAARLQRDDIAPMLETVRGLAEDERSVPPDVLEKLLALGVPPDAVIQVLALAPSPKQTADGFRRGHRSTSLWIDLLASTGHPAAWSILVATHDHCVAERLPFDASRLALLRMAHRQPDEERLAVLRKLASENARQGRSTTPVLLTLLTLGDEPTLALLKGNEAPAEHPLAPAGSAVAYRPIAYLFTDSAKPPAHRFSTAQLTTLLLRLRDDPAGFGTSSLSPHDLADDLGDDHVRLLATLILGSFSQGNGESRTWCDVALARARQHNGQNGWAAWLEAALEVPATRYHLLRAMTEVELRARLPQLRRWAAGGNQADTALDALVRAGEKVDVGTAIGDQDPTVRRWALQQVLNGKAEVPAAAMVPFLAARTNRTRMDVAQYFGKNLATEAVPGLIALLRDEQPHVREAAEQALTRIRFYHEQQAHWDRVLRGLDASPASAMEKLLLQARPDAPKAQRLLAIPSLGSLGKAEALPFLIDWSNEDDAEIAAAAKAAITRIHLEPRR